MSFRVIPIPNRADNYAYLLIDTTSKKAAAIDAVPVDDVLQTAKDEGVDIVSVITTHHHFDHSQGNEALLKALLEKEKANGNANPNVPVFGGQGPSSAPVIPALNKPVKQGDKFTLGENLDITCLSTPSHTHDSICYHVVSRSDGKQCVFTGDTLFLAGCGRFFEGTPEEMHKSLNTTLASLPDATIVYPGHEYTKGNLAFARSVDNQNPALDRLQKLVEENPVTTGKSTIKDEKEWNPFMRIQDESIKKATGKTDPVDVMGELRTLKNKF